MGTWNSTGQPILLSEDIKNFADDMYDRQIINLAGRQYYPDSGVTYMLVNKHGATMTGIKVETMRSISEYCRFLIDIGAVKDAKIEDSPEPVVHADHNYAGQSTSNSFRSGSIVSG